MAILFHQSTSHPRPTLATTFSRTRSPNQPIPSLIESAAVMSVKSPANSEAGGVISPSPPSSNPRVSQPRVCTDFLQPLGTPSSGHHLPTTYHFTRRLSGSQHLFYNSRRPSLLWNVSLSKAPLSAATKSITSLSQPQQRTKIHLPRHPRINTDVKISAMLFQQALPSSTYLSPCCETAIHRPIW
jgi:hypothetical protein